MSLISKQLDDLRRRVEEAGVDLPSSRGNNDLRRKLYSEVELYRLRVLVPKKNKAQNGEEGKEKGKENKDEKTQVEKMSSADGKDNVKDGYEEEEKVLDDLVSKLNLQPVRKSSSYIGKFLRLTSLIFSLMIAGVFLALPMILLRVVEKQFSLKSNFSEVLRRKIAQWLLLVSGVVCEVEGLDDRTFQESCVLLTFSHASNLDGFMISYTCPVRHYALAKKELFLVPFFSWISLAFGGVPVDRNHRERAIQALQRSTEEASSASAGKMCLVIAPEGTRSKSGQLKSFKKGAFHMWQQMQAPIVPFITFGAYDLYPVGSWINNVGRVHARYLRPILPHEAKSREEMSNLLRERMLEELKKSPENASSQLTAAETMMHHLAIVITWTASYFISKRCYTFLSVNLQLSRAASVGVILAVSVLVTMFLYIYYVYVVTMGGSNKKDDRVDTAQKKKNE